MLEIVNIDIDKDVIISCPDRDFKVRRACVSCSKCEYFDGIGKMSESNATWSENYTIRCKHPVERRTHMIPKVLEE